ncbi:outer membrane beta-barrel protein [Microbulbifer sp. SH-1]|nr:outer membrane beta-barrel protein [Microbulbifer sp. SH-1]
MFAGGVPPHIFIFLFLSFRAGDNMGLSASRRLLCSAIGMIVASQGQAAAIKLDAFVDGKPAAVTEVLLDGKAIGSSAAGESFWYDDLPGGGHQLQLRIGERVIPYEFTIGAEEAAVIIVNSESASGRAIKSLQRLELSAFDSAGAEGEGIASSGEESLLPGLIQGKVVSAGGNTPLRNVTVKVAGSDQSTVTDRFGAFELELPQGVYQLELQHPEFQTSRLRNQRVLSKMNLAVDVQLSPKDAFAGGDAPVVEEVQVLGRYLPGNPIEIERISSSVVDSIDFTQISRFDDSMVSSALKRVVGVSMEDDRYAVVRGMKSRYQSTEFNGATLPSTDPARRDLPLDIFPAGIMQGLSLQKSATADVPSTATAGHISMRTRDIPEAGFFKISSSITHGDNHGDDMVISDTEGDRDWLGMDDGSRELPNELTPSLQQWVNLDNGAPGYGGFNEEEVIRMGQSLRHNAIYKGEALGDSSMDFSGGNSWDIGEQSLGVIGALRYSNKWSNSTKKNSRFAKYNERIALIEFAETEDTNNIIDLSAMLNLQWNINDRHQLGLNNIALRHTTNSAELEHFEDVSTGHEFKFQRTDWIEEELLSHQVWGSHSFDISAGGWSAYLGDLSVDWQLMNAGTEYDRPNATQYTYQKGVTGTDSYGLVVKNFGDHYNLWETMEEANSGYRLDVALPIEDIFGVSLLLKVGANDLQRERDGYHYRYSLSGRFSSAGIALAENADPSQAIIPEVIVGRPGLGDGPSGLGSMYIYVGGLDPAMDTGLEGDSYIVEQNSDATYGLVEANILEQVKVNLGVRRENFYMAGEQYMYTVEPMTELLDEERTSPSLSVTYLFSDAWQLRAAYSETVSWPEIFEVLPRKFNDIETLEQYEGNPDLKPADIENLDLRLEWYPSDTESVTLALFSKDITNAIENRFDGLGDVFDYYTFTNAESAEVYGAELDLRREFVLGREQGHEFFVQFNYTDIMSSVDVTEGSGIFEYDTERPLQGQPDYIVNLQLGYDHVDSGQEVTLVFNRKGEELAIVNPGISAAVSNVYEMPFDDLKLIYMKGFDNGLSLSASVENLLDAERNLEYETQELPYLQYSSGRKFKFKASYSF